MSVRTQTDPDDLKKRLRRIEGQVRGVAKMIDEDRNCREVVQQLTAIRSAVQQVSLLVVRGYAVDCLLPTPGAKSPAESLENLDSLIDVLSKTT